MLGGFFLFTFFAGGFGGWGGGDHHVFDCSIGKRNQRWRSGGDRVEMFTLEVFDVIPPQSAVRRIYSAKWVRRSVSNSQLQRAYYRQL